jgi:hypothetical protein
VGKGFTWGVPFSCLDPAVHFGSLLRPGGAPPAPAATGVLATSSACEPGVTYTGGSGSEDGGGPQDAAAGMQDAASPPALTRLCSWQVWNRVLRVISCAAVLWHLSCLGLPTSTELLGARQERQITSLLCSTWHAVHLWQSILLRAQARDKKVGPGSCMLPGCSTCGRANMLISSSLLQGTLQRSGVVQQFLARVGAAAQIPSGSGSRSRIRVPVAPASPAGENFSCSAAAVDGERQQEAGSLAHGCTDDSRPADAAAVPQQPAATAAPAVMLSAPAAAAALAEETTAASALHKRCAHAAAPHQPDSKRRLPKRITHRDEAAWHALAVQRPATVPFVQVPVDVTVD